MKQRKRFLFVVDTLDYSGNFERQLCGYICGRTRDFSGDHGEDEAEIANKELSDDQRGYFEAHTVLIVDEEKDNQPMTPVIIYPTPGWFNNGMGGHFLDGQEKEALEAAKKETAAYNKAHPGADVRVGPKLTKHPAYQSVAIVFDERPPQAIIDLLKKRTGDFVKYWAGVRTLGMKVRVTGFRIVEETHEVNIKAEAV